LWPASCCLSGAPGTGDPMIQRVLSLHQASCSSTQAACERYDLLVLAASLPSGPGQDAPKPPMQQICTPRMDPDPEQCADDFFTALASVHHLVYHARPAAPVLSLYFYPCCLPSLCPCWRSGQGFPLPSWCRTALPGTLQESALP